MIKTGGEEKKEKKGMKEEREKLKLRLIFYQFTFQMVTMARAGPC